MLKHFTNGLHLAYLIPHQYDGNPARVHFRYYFVCLFYNFINGWESELRHTKSALHDECTAFWNLCTCNSRSIPSTNVTGIKYIIKQQSTSTKYVATVDHLYSIIMLYVILNVPVSDFGNLYSLVCAQNGSRGSCRWEMIHMCMRCEIYSIMRNFWIKA